MVTKTSGSRKNSAKTSIIGAACSSATKDLLFCIMNRLIRSLAKEDLSRLFSATSSEMASGRNKFVPLADHVVVFVHDGVPAGDGAHAVVIGAAVAHGAGLLEHRAVGRLDVADGRLAFHPVAPFVGRHIGLGA